MNAITLGRQTFDGLGRQRAVEVAGRTTLYHYRPGQLPPCANTLADGRRVDFAYEPRLNDVLLSSSTEGGHSEQLHYHPCLGQPTEASGALGTLKWSFSPAGLPQQESWVIDGAEHITHWRTSLGGKPLGFVGANGTEQQRHYDALGRLAQIITGKVSTRISYDALSRVAQVTTQDQDARVLVRQLSYDAMGREASNTFSLTENGATRTFTQTLGYNALDQLIRRTGKYGQQEADERFAYDSRGRMVRFTANTNAAPRDPFGNAIVEQRFVFNELDGYRQVISRFNDGSEDIAQFHYAAADPCRVVAIDHSHSSWPARIELTYDAHGRVIADSLGRKLTWDAHERLQSVEHGGKTCEYRYTPNGQLRDRTLNGSLNRSFFSGRQLTHEHRGNTTLEVIGDGSTLFAVSAITEGVRQTTLLGCDGQGSVRLKAGDQVRMLQYSPHGSEQGNDQQQPFGYAGERREPLTGWYIAAGYRPYDPLLMCFLAPDSESPFGHGGINAYTYCGGDPVNRIDPDGHSWQTWVIAGIGLAVGALATVASFGAALAAGGILSASGALAVATAALNIVSLGTGAAAMAMQVQGKNEQAANVLGWISLGTGLSSIATGGLTRMAGKSVSTLKRSNALRKPAVHAPKNPQHPIDVMFRNPRTNRAEVVWYDDAWGRGIKAFETHGGKDGVLMNAAGQYEDAARIALREIAPRVANAPAGEPIVLLACWGGKSGAAQRIADVLQRPVYGTDKITYVPGVSRMDRLDVGNLWSTVPMQKISRYRRLFGAKGPFDFDSTLEPATGRMYFP